jgi:uncharacterized protein with HEPN domain
MARMRDKLIHHYRGVDLQEIWKLQIQNTPFVDVLEELLAKK